jgi:hypothetical protein
MCGWSGRQDLNLRPPAPKAGALAKLSYAPVVWKRASHSLIGSGEGPRTVAVGGSGPNLAAVRPGSDRTADRISR